MPPTKRKAEASQDEDSSKKNRKLSKEEKAEARDRARQAVMRPSAAATSTSAAAAAASKKKKAPTVTRTASPKRAAAKKRSSTARVTLPEETERDNNEMAMPPPQLHRTQSTPLELELEQQVIANAKADMAAEPLPFTGVPPAHLMKFAPKEADEGYDLPENNDGETWVDGAAEAKAKAKKAKAILPSLGHIMVLEASVVLGWFYFFYIRQGAYFHPFFRNTMSKIPFQANPYRTANGRVVPLLPCFVTNVDEPPIHYRKECRNEELKFEACPAFGECYGGNLQACKAPYLEMSKSGKKCVLKAPVFHIYEHVLRQAEAWTLAHSCKALATDTAVVGNGGASQVGKSSMLTYDSKYSGMDDGAGDLSPEPYMFVTMKDTTPWTKQPMFAMDFLLDLDPFLLAPLRKDYWNGPPVESLYALLEATNPLRHQLKLQILTRYGTDESKSENSDNNSGEEGDEVEEPPVQQSVDHLHLVALVPSMQATWRRDWVSLERQCQLLDYQSRVQTYYEAKMETPWFVYCWFVSMAMVGAWLCLLQYYLKRAHQQQDFLQHVQDVHVFILATLEDTKPKLWEGRELKKHALENCASVAEVSQDHFYKKVWPRVVFESRPDRNVAKSVIVKGGDLVDLWKWEPMPDDDEEEEE